MILARSITHDTRMLKHLDLAQQVVTLPLHHLLRFLSAIWSVQLAVAEARVYRLTHEHDRFVEIFEQGCVMVEMRLNEVQLLCQFDIVVLYNFGFLGIDVMLKEGKKVERNTHEKTRMLV